jgi:hypothetical protein
VEMTREQALVALRRASSYRTICEVHREIFDAAETLPQAARDRIQNLVLDAFIMGKKMDAKLKEYKADWDAGFYELNTDRRADRHRRKK